MCIRDSPGALPDQPSRVNCLRHHRGFVQRYRPPVRQRDHSVRWQRQERCSETHPQNLRCDDHPEGSDQSLCSLQRSWNRQDQNRKQRFIAALERLGADIEHLPVEHPPEQRVEPARKAKATSKRTGPRKTGKGGAQQGKANPAVVTTKPKRRAVTTAPSED